MAISVRPGFIPVYARNLYDDFIPNLKVDGKLTDDQHGRLSDCNQCKWEMMSETNKKQIKTISIYDYN